MSTLEQSQHRRWMVRLATGVLLMPLVAISAAAPSSPAEPSPAGRVNLDRFERVVLSTSEGEFDEGVKNQGWWATSNGNQNGNANYLVGECQCPAYGRYRNFFTFDLAPVKSTVIAAKLVIRRHANEGDRTETLALYDVHTPAPQLNDNTGVNLAIFRDLGTGTRYGRFQVATEADPEAVAAFWLNTAAVADINAARGDYFSIGGSLVSAPRSNGYQERLFATSSGRRGGGVQELRLFIEHR